MATTPIAANNLLSLVNPVNKVVHTSDMLLGASGALDLKLNATKAPEKGFDKVFEQEARSIRPEKRTARKSDTQAAIDDKKDLTPAKKDKEVTTDSQKATKSERQEAAKEGKALPNKVAKEEKAVEQTATAQVSTETVAKPVQAKAVELSVQTTDMGSDITTSEAIAVVNPQETTTSSNNVGLQQTQENDQSTALVAEASTTSVDTSVVPSEETVIANPVVNNESKAVSDKSVVNPLANHLAGNDVAKQVRQAVMAMQSQEPQQVLNANNATAVQIATGDDPVVQANNMLLNAGAKNQQVSEEGVNVLKTAITGDAELKADTSTVKLDTAAGSKTTQQQQANTNTNNFAALLQQNTNVMSKMADKVVQSSVNASSVAAVAKTAAAAPAATETSTAALKSADSSLTAAKTSPVLTAKVPVTHKNWGEAVMQNVMYMSSKSIKQAEINLDPPELGALQVRINTQGDQTTVQFATPNPAAREALEQNLNRLREMMEEQGMQLVDADVNDGREQQMAQDQSSEESESRQDGSLNAQENGEEEQVAVVETKLEDVGLVDSYA